MSTQLKNNGEYSERVFIEASETTVVSIYSTRPNQLYCGALSLVARTGDGKMRKRTGRLELSKEGKLGEHIASVPGSVSSVIRAPIVFPSRKCCFFPAAARFLCICSRSSCPVPLQSSCCSPSSFEAGASCLKKVLSRDYKCYRPNYASHFSLEKLFVQ